MRHGSRRVGWFAAALLVGATAVAGCTKDVGEPVADESSSAPTEAELVDWVGKVHEIVVHCSEHSESADDSLDAQGSLVEATDHNAEVIAISGQAIELCDYALDGHHHQPTAEELAEIWPEGTEALEEWLDAMARAHRSAVIVAAGNGDSRPLVTELFANQHEADDLADELDQLVEQQAKAVGLTMPDEGLGIHRWNPPHH
jgi:hypothetical protein